MISETADRVLEIGSSAEIEQRRRSFLRWAGWTGLLGTAAFMVTIVMTTGGVASPGGPTDIIRYLDDVSSNGSIEYVYGIAGIVLVFLYVPMAVGIYRLMAESIAGWYGTMAVVLGLLVLLPAYVINLFAPFVFVPLSGELGASGADVLYADYSVARAAAELFFTVGSLLTLSIGPFMWGAGWLRSRLSGRWLGWVGVLTGLTGLVWFVWLMENGVISSVLIVNVVLSLIFFAGASIALVSVSRRRAV